MIPATPVSELELGMQILSGVTTASTGIIAWHAYWPRLLAVPCAIIYLAFVAKVPDQVAEHAVCCPTQTGFVDQCEASYCHGDERDGRCGEHECVSGWGNETGNGQESPQQTRWSPCNKGSLLVRLARQVAPRDYWGL